MAGLIDSVEGRYFRAALYDNVNSDVPGVSSCEVSLTRKERPRGTLVIDAGASEPYELVEVAASLASLQGKWEGGPTQLQSSERSFEVEFDREAPVRIAQLRFYEWTLGELEGRAILVVPYEVEDLLAVAKGVAARHAELNLLARGFDPGHEPILTLVHGRFRAEVCEHEHVLTNGSSHWPTYREALYADGKNLWPPDSGFKCTRLLDRLRVDGKVWLTNYLTARGLLPPGENDLLDFQKTLVETELRHSALFELAGDNEENKDRLRHLEGEVAQPKRLVDFRLEELGEENWRITPLSARAEEYVERFGVEQRWRKGQEDEYLLDSSCAALDVMQHLKSSGYRLKNQWLDLRNLRRTGDRDPTRGPHMSEQQQGRRRSDARDPIEADATAQAHDTAPEPTASTAQDRHFVEIDFKAWVATYRPVEDKHSAFPQPRLHETYGSDLETVKKTDPSRVWTLVECDDGTDMIHSGFQLVNRLGYYITDEPCPAHLKLEVTLSTQVIQDPHDAKEQVKVVQADKPDQQRNENASAKREDVMPEKQAYLIEVNQLRRVDTVASIDAKDQQDAIALLERETERAWGDDSTCVDQKTTVLAINGLPEKAQIPEAADHQPLTETKERTGEAIHRYEMRVRSNIRDYRVIAVDARDQEEAKNKALSHYDTWFNERFPQNLTGDETWIESQEVVTLTEDHHLLHIDVPRGWCGPTAEYERVYRETTFGYDRNLRNLEALEKLLAGKDHRRIELGGYKDTPLVVERVDNNLIVITAWDQHYSHVPGRTTIGFRVEANEATPFYYYCDTTGKHFQTKAAHRDIPQIRDRQDELDKLVQTYWQELRDLFDIDPKLRENKSAFANVLEALAIAAKTEPTPPAAALPQEQPNNANRVETVAIPQAVRTDQSDAKSNSPPQQAPAETHAAKPEAPTTNTPEAIRSSVYRDDPKPERKEANSKKSNHQREEAVPLLLEALDYLLEQTVDMDLKCGFALDKGQKAARVKALAAIAQATKPPTNQVDRTAEASENQPHAVLADSSAAPTTQQEMNDFDQCLNETIRVDALAARPGDKEEHEAKVNEAARRAQTALSQYQNGDCEDDLTDCLTDMLHWSRANGVDFTAKLEMAQCHFRTETAEAATQQQQRRPQKRESGVVRAFIWDNGLEGEPTVTFSRIYMDQKTGEWAYSSSLRERDLSDLNQLVREAARVLDHNQEQKANQTGSKETRAKDRGQDRER